MNGGRRELAGRYKLDRVLSTDSSGTAYLAKDRRTGAKVTVKELAAGLASDRDYIEGLRGSAASITSFDDPNFVSVLDFVESDGRAYVVSVYVEGQTLREVMDAKEIAPPESLALLRGSLLGVAAVNSAGLVHGSISPDNVILLPDGQVKLTGFDQPAFVAAAGGGNGSPSGVSPYAYIAPEQVVGAAADARTDVYLAGLLGYELLAGMPPFTSPDPSQVMSMHIAHDAPRLDVMHPGIPASVAEIIGQALAKEPDDRQQGARSFIAQIDAAVPSLSPAWALAMVPGALAPLLVPAPMPLPVAPTPAPRRVPVRVAPRVGWRGRGALVPGAAALSLTLAGGAAFAYSQRWLGNGGQTPSRLGPNFTASSGIHPGGRPGGSGAYVVPPASNPPASNPPAEVTQPASPPSPAAPGGGGAVAVIPVVIRVPPITLQPPPITGVVVPPVTVTPPPPPPPPVTGPVQVPSTAELEENEHHDGDHPADKDGDKDHDGDGKDSHHDVENGEHAERD
jgi:hypothetical protein